MLSVASVIIEDWQGEQQAGWNARRPNTSQSQSLRLTLYRLNAFSVLCQAEAEGQSERFN